MPIFIVKADEYTTFRAPISLRFWRLWDQYLIDSTFFDDSKTIQLIQPNYVSNSNNFSI